MKPSGVEINSKRYRIIPDSYREWVESSYQAQPAIAGTSRPSENPRPEVRTWRIDDWSAGEGYKFFKSTDGHPSQRGYFLSSAGVEVTKFGEVSLGRTLTTSFDPAVAIAGTMSLTKTGSSVWVAYNAVTKEQTALDTWTTRTSGMNAQNITGPISGHHSGVFIAGTRSAGDGGLRRVTSAGNTQWTATTCQAALAADNRVYALIRGTTTSTLNRVGLDAAAAFPATPIATFNGVGSTYAGRPVCSAAVGSRIFTLLANDNENVRVWILENDVAREFAILDGLQVQSTDTAPERMCVVNGVVYVCGFHVVRPGAGRIGRVDWLNPNGSWGTLTTLDHEFNSESPGTVSLEFFSIKPGKDSELVLGGSLGDLYRFDLRPGGGLSRIAAPGSSSAFTSTVFLDGYYYVVDQVTDGIVKRTNVFPSSSTITEPIWDFNLPDTEKILTEIEIQTETLATGTSVEVQVVLDGTTTVTTDASAATIAHTSGTRTIFTISGASVERTFRYIQPKILLKTSNTAHTPILYSVTVRCVPVPNKFRFFEFDVDLTDESASGRRTGQQRTANLQRNEIETLRDSTSDRLFTFIPLWKSPDPRMYPGPTQTSYTVMWAPNTANGIYASSDQGEGRMKIRLLKVP